LAEATRRPDFLAQGSSGDAVIEATTTGTAAAEAARMARTNAVHDAINRLRVKNFMLDMTIIREGERPPPTGGLIRELEQWLDSLDVDVVAAAMSVAEGNYLVDPASPRHIWTHEGWQLEFQPIPLKSEARNQLADPPIGMWGPGAAAMIDDASPIRDRLQRRARAYGILRRPYLIAIETNRPFADNDDFVDALFGPLAFTFYVGVPESGQWFGRPVGLWRSRAGWQYANVSGVICAINVNPWSIGQVQPLLWHHPAATYPITDVPPLFRQARLDEASGEVTQTPAAVAAEAFFELPDGWPGPDEERFGSG
jgi:hypothetical protein